MAQRAMALARVTPIAAVAGAFGVAFSGSCRESAWLEGCATRPRSSRLSMASFQSFAANSCIKASPILCDTSSLSARQNEIAKSVDLMDLLKTSGFMKRIPIEVIGRIINSGEVMFLKKGQSIIHEGEVNDGLFAIAHGSIAILINGRQVQSVGKGVLVGEGALVSKAMACATCRAIDENTMVLKVPHSVIRAQLKDTPEILDFLKEQSNRIHIQNISYELLQNVVVFEDSSQEFLQELVKLLRFVSFDAGEEIAKVGKKDDGGLFLIKSGVVDAITEEGVVITQLHESMYFGEASLLSASNETRNTSCKASCFVEAYQLRRSDFMKIASKYPESVQRMKKVVQEKNRGLLKRKSSSVIRDRDD